MKANFRALQSPALTCARAAEMTVPPVHLKLCSELETPVWVLISVLFSGNT